MSGALRTGWAERVAWALLVLFVFSLPWEKGIMLPGIGTVSRLLGMAAFVGGVAVAIRRKSVRFPNLALALAALFVLWTGLTYFWSLAQHATASRILTFVQLAGMLWLIWDSCRTERQQWQLLQAYVAGAALGSVDTLVRYVQNSQTYYRRYAAAGFDPNDFGLTIALAIPLALYLAMRARGASQWLYRTAVALVIVAILLTASRSALVATFLAFGFALWTWRESGRAQKVANLALLAVLVLGTVRFAPAASRARLATLPEELTQGTLHNRTRIWKTGLKVLKRHPFFGVGAGAYPEAVRPWLGTPGIPGHQYVAHNTFLSVLVEEGLAGFTLYGLLLVTLALYVWMMPFAERVLWSVMLAVWATGVLTLTWEHRKPTWLIFGLILTAWARAFLPDEKTVP